MNVSASCSVCGVKPSCAAPQSQVPSFRAAPAVPKRSAVSAKALNGKQSNFEESVRRVVKKVQGALPIIGLLSRLTSPEGGFDAVSYMEFGRTMFDTMTPECNSAVSALEKKYGKSANTRWMFLVLWMAKYGSGIVSNKEIISAARRVRYSQDLEVEIERFENARTEAVKKYSLMELPEGSMKDKLSVAVDAISLLCAGLKEGEPLSEEDSNYFRSILLSAFPQADPSLVKTVIEERGNRGKLYT